MLSPHKERALNLEHFRYWVGWALEKSLGVRQRPPVLGSTLRMKQQLGKFLPVLGFWGRNTLAYVGTMAFHRYFPSTTMAVSRLRTGSTLFWAWQVGQRKCKCTRSQGWRQAACLGGIELQRADQRPAAHTGCNRFSHPLKAWISMPQSTPEASPPCRLVLNLLLVNRSHAGLSGTVLVWRG